MFKRHDPQLNLFQAHLAYSGKLRRKIETSWAHVVRDEILPSIPEEPFRDLYCTDNGAPNFPVRILVALSILKELLGLRDRDLLDAFHFNALFHYALALAPGQLTLAERTLYYFRARVAGNPAVERVFEALTDAILARASLCTAFQRIDSTQITSNMAHLNRLGLFVRTLAAFLKMLDRKAPAALACVPQAIRDRYLERSGFFGDPRSSESRRCLEQAAQDLATLLAQFEKDQAVGPSKAYRLLQRLFAEQCRVESTAGLDRLVVLKDPKEVGSGSMQNPSDPDATYNAHKGKGYKVQLAETCTEGNPFEVITAVALQPANQGDVKALVPLIEQTKARGCGPQTVVADTNYGGAANLLAAAEQGVDLLSPTPGTADPDGLSLLDFALEGDPPAIVRCPEGHAPAERRATSHGDNLRFDPSICRACELCDVCPAGKDKGRLKVTDAALVTAWNRARERTDEFLEAYAIRAGIEATNSELKRAHRLGRVWCRGAPRVAFAVFFKAIACNVKRFAQWRCAPKPRPVATALACAPGC